MQAPLALMPGVLQIVTPRMPAAFRSKLSVPVPHTETILSLGHAWKTPSLKFLLDRASFSGKRSTPYSPGAVHDYMHAKVSVCDDTVFIGSFNLSRAGETNAENVVEIEDAALADRMAGFVDSIRTKYPPLALG